ncbi:hypothetical protein [Canicola haemoglobinophilus]|uniref:hypothetical protein n=1 Tax=Canicola haemoglobinophilus TaxID=733 RepID=UPI0013011EEA|nr:hypothetical protein [Canicola haemoglobinophilus]
MPQAFRSSNGSSGCFWQIIRNSLFFFFLLNKKGADTTQPRFIKVCSTYSRKIPPNSLFFFYFLVLMVLYRGIELQEENNSLKYTSSYSGGDGYFISTKESLKLKSGRRNYYCEFLIFGTWK